MSSQDDKPRNWQGGDAPYRGCLVSVIVPVYNVRPYLTECLGSLVGQTYQNLEILVVDDGSTDGSGEICDQFAKRDSRIKVVHQENKGLGAARNAGLDIATGSVLAFLDSDDAFCSNAIQKSLDEMITTNAEITLFKCKSVRTEGRLEREALTVTNAWPSIQKGVYDRAAIFLNLVDEKINIPVWNKIYSAALWGDLRFPEGVAYEDYAATVSILNKATRIVVLDEPLVFYRKRPGSITAVSSFQRISDLNDAFSYFESFIGSRATEYCSIEALQRDRRRKFERLFREYALFVRSNPKERKAALDIRSLVLEVGRKVSFDHCGLLLRAMYFLSRFPPRSLPFLLRCFCLFRGFAKSFLRR